MQLEFFPAGSQEGLESFLMKHLTDGIAPAKALCECTGDLLNK
jgi:hypothetical protein